MNVVVTMAIPEFLEPVSLPASMLLCQNNEITTAIELLKKLVIPEFLEPVGLLASVLLCQNNKITTTVELSKKLSSQNF